MSDPLFFDYWSETLEPHQVASRQRSLLTRMFEVVFERNPFYRHKFQAAGRHAVPQLEDWPHFPFTTKSELVEDAEAHPPYGSNLTYPLEQYVRLHQTSGTTGRPMTVLDTRESWEEWKKCWAIVFRAAGVSPGDRIFVAFSFGRFIGFWAAFEAIELVGCRALSGGGQTSLQRLAAIRDHGATVLVCTPSYALHLGEIAREQQMDLSNTSVRTTIHAGEPGASIAATRQRIEDLWGAKCFDHVGASEVGAYGFQCHLQPEIVHINERSFICECIDPVTFHPVAPGEMGELVITNLNRWGSPAIRYRTGDLVRLSEPKFCACGRSFRSMIGGVLSRVDDMFVLRGMNIFPSAIEAVLHKFKEVAEFEGRIFTDRGLDQLLLKVELSADAAPHAAQLKGKLEEELRNALAVRIDIELTEVGSLPRHEMKARRFKRV